ncbi:MAG: hypothetical protein IH991_18440 [Planctomycetes bacterium]|nr:hypothetical protein [Planctomycetota bacterium]
MRGSILSLVCFGPLLATALWAEQPATRREGPLAELPSKPGEHLAKIKALKQGEWLELGPPKADPKWGRARGRSWTAKMPLAPKLRGAFLFGQGVHGYVKPNGHYMDDLWFYDINAHRWICCYPGANTNTLKLSINKDGFESTEGGEPIPVAAMGHGYEMTAYDTENEQFIFVPCGDPYWKKPLARREQWFKPAPNDASPWSFDTATGKWLRQRTGTPGPQFGFGDTLEHLPARKELFFAHRSKDVWFYNTQTNKWRRARPKGPPPPFGIDCTACYDTNRDRIYMGGGGYPTTPSGENAFWIYDVKTNTWINQEPKGAPCRGATGYNTNNALMLYDSASDVVLLLYHSFNYTKKEKLGIYVYHPESNSWSDKVLPIPEKLGGSRKCKNGFYDPSLNAVFLHAAGDSRDDSEMWVFRFKP